MTQSSQIGELREQAGRPASAKLPGSKFSFLAGAFPFLASVHPEFCQYLLARLPRHSIQLKKGSLS